MEEDIALKEMFTQAMSAFIGNDYKKCVGLLTEVISRDEGNRLALTTRGAAFFKLGNNESALSDLNKAVAVDDSHARAFHLRGLVREKLGDDQGALKDFDRAIRLDPEYAAAYYSRATQNTKLGRMEEAQSDAGMFTHLTHVNLESFANENNIWHSRHLQVEENLLESELNR